MSETPQARDNANSPARLRQTIDDIIRKRYVGELERMDIVPCPKGPSPGDTACLFPVRRIVYDKHENIFQKLSSVYTGASSIGANVVMILNHPKPHRDVELYMGIYGAENPGDATTKAAVFRRNLLGNFPGCQTGDMLDVEAIGPLLRECLDSSRRGAVSSVSCVASLRDEERRENRFYFQGIEKLIDGMNDRVYSVLILAQAIGKTELHMIAE